MRSARRGLADMVAAPRARGRAEVEARKKQTEAEKLARRKRLAVAVRTIDEGAVIAEDAGAVSLAGELNRRRKVLAALAAAHRAIRARFRRPGFRLPASTVFPAWPKDASIVAADETKVRVEFAGVGNHVDKRWETLSAAQYARLAAGCARADRPAEMLGAGLAWLEAGDPDRAMALWNECGAPKEETLLFLGAGGGPAAVTDALRRARRLETGGREREALSLLAEILGREAAPRGDAAELRGFVRSVARDVHAASGLAASCRPGPGEAEELCYDFSRAGWRGDWRLAAGRIRQDEYAAVSPSGGTCTIEFEGAFVSAVEVTCRVRFLEEAGCGVEVVFAPDADDAAARAGRWVSVRYLSKLAPARRRFDTAHRRQARYGRTELVEGAPATLPPLVRRPGDVVFLRRWDGVSLGLATPSAEAKAGQRRPPARFWDTRIASAPEGPERVAVSLVGWVELRSVRLRGVVDPEWRERVRRRREEAARQALAPVLGGVPGEGDNEQLAPLGRARALEEVRALYLDCRSTALRATRRIAAAYDGAGEPALADAARSLGRLWFPGFDGRSSELPRSGASPAMEH